MESFLTEEELARVLRCSKEALRVWRRQGMPYQRFGTLVRYSLPAVLRWHEARSQGHAHRKPRGESATAA